MLMPFHAEVEFLHAPAAAFLQPQSSSLRDHQPPAGWDRARLFDSERFEREFIMTLADLRGNLGFRIVGYVLIRQLTDCRLLLWPKDGTNPTQPACSAGPAVWPCGFSSGARFLSRHKQNKLVLALPHTEYGFRERTSRAVKSTARWKSRRAEPRALRYIPFRRRGVNTTRH